MKKRSLLCSLLSLTLIFQCNSQIVTAKKVTKETKGSVLETGSYAYAENELLVTYKSDTGKVVNLPDGVEEEAITDSCSLFTVEDNSSMQETIHTIATDLDVAYVEPNYTVTLFETNDTHSSKQWSYYNTNSNINAENAWALGSGENKETVVAVIDTGIDYQHADLKENIWENIDESYESTRDNDKNDYPGDYYGWNFSDNNNVICNYDFIVENGDRVAVDIHGTHIAGIIDAVADNKKGIAGLASYSNVKVMSLKVMEATEDGITSSVSNIVKAIEYAEKNGATICNLSLGTASYSSALYAAIKNSSMLFVCAAGNGEHSTNNQGYDISNTPVYPASFDLDNMISVANANSTGELDDSSCYSKTDVDIAAPGTQIASCYVDENHTDIGTYGWSTGTSMAAPFVTATAAMISSYYGGELSSLDIKKMILGGSKKVDALSSKVADGAYLDVYGAMTYTGLLASVTTSIKEINKSNEKKYVIKVNNPLSDDLTVLYAKGKKDSAYFNSGENESIKPISNEKETIRVKESSYYTVYIKDSTGNEAIYTEKVTIPKLTKIKFTVTKKTLHVDDLYRLKVQLLEKNVYAKVTYKSSNKKVAKVSSRGNIRAIKKGTATITATAIYGNVKKTTTCKIVVK